MSRKRPKPEEIVAERRDEGSVHRKVAHVGGDALAELRDGGVVALHGADKPIPHP